jgi:hypothetical protein
MDSCEHDNVLSCILKDGEIIDRLIYFMLLKKVCHSMELFSVYVVAVPQRAGDVCSYTVPKTSLDVCYHQTEMQTVRLHFQHTMGARIAISETQVFSSVSLPVAGGMICPERYFRRTAPLL